jgi:hypothetical protein
LEDFFVPRSAPAVTRQPSPQTDTLAADLLRGAEAIQHFVGDHDVRQTYYALATGRYPARKIKGEWIGSKKVLTEFFHTPNNTPKTEPPTATTGGTRLRHCTIEPNGTEVSRIAEPVAAEASPRPLARRPLRHADEHDTRARSQRRARRDR